MKKIFCPKCDDEITLSDQRLRELKQAEGERIAIVCPSCTHQLRIRLRATESQTSTKEAEYFGHITILENVFGYKQRFPLSWGLNHIGRRNKDTLTDIPIITGDPSMDRHHCIIKVSQTKKERTLWSLMDNESRVGTFVAGDILGVGEWRHLSDGDIITLGATTIIFSTSPIPEEELGNIEGEGIH